VPATGGVAVATAVVDVARVEEPPGSVEVGAELLTEPRQLALAFGTYTDAQERETY
jgi:hypothetical protein